MTKKELRELSKFAFSFVDEYLPGSMVSHEEETFMSTWATLTQSGRGFVRVYKAKGEIVAAIGGLLVPGFHGGSTLICQEGFWFTAQEYRGMGLSKLLYEELEQWAKSNNANVMTMHSPATNSGVKEVYKKWGFTEMETIWGKKIGGNDE